MKNKKGFTLIELLTVIAVLVVILIIAIPAILNVLEKAKKNAFIDSGISIVKSFEKGNAVSNILSNAGVTLPSNGNSISVSLSNINYDKADDITGNIVIRNESGKYKYYLYITNGEYSICNKEYDKVQLEDVEKKEGCGVSLYPTLTLVETESTTSSITITTSEEPGTISTTTTCVYGTSNTYGSSCTSTSESESTITGLEPSTEYFFKICEVDSSNNEVSCVSDSETTKVPITGEIEIAASWPNTTSMELTLSGITSNNALEYRCVVGTHDTGWQSSSTCNITNLTAGTAYTVAAYVRDSVITTAEVTKTTTIYTAKEVVSSSAITQNSTCQTPTPTTTISGDEIYDSVTLNGTCNDASLNCSASYGATTSASLPATSQILCGNTSKEASGGGIVKISSAAFYCNVSSSSGIVDSCSSRDVSCNLNSCSYYSSLVSKKSATSIKSITCNGAKVSIYPSSYYSDSLYYTEWSYYYDGETISRSQNYSICTNSSSCSYAVVVADSTRCGSQMSWVCNGETVTMSSKCYGYSLSGCCSSSVSSWINSYYATVSFDCARGGMVHMGYHALEAYRGSCTGYDASSMYNRISSDSAETYSYCLSHPTGSCYIYASLGVSTIYSTFYSFSSSWTISSGYSISYTSLKITSGTNGYYYRTYSTVINYAEYSYSSSTAYPKQSLY